MTVSEDTFDALRELEAALSCREENEAETRHKLIDFVIHQILSWPKNRVSVEEYISPGFADYVLKKANGDHLLFIEAKRGGIYFTVPAAFSASETASYVPVKRLMSDAAIKSAMEQVRTYCVDTGCEFACITNGREWIFFKTFERGAKWDSLKAFVVRGLSFFEREYTKAFNSLSYSSITERSSLSELLSASAVKDRNIYYAKEKIASYSHPINPHKFAGTLRPLVSKYFGVIGDDDAEFMDRCYVSQRDYAFTLDGMRSLIHDSLSPYFESFGVKQLEDTGHGGRIGGRLTKSLKAGKGGEVLILFGGKGAGKSTFIKRLLHHNPPRWLRDNAMVAIVDLLPTPDDRSAIKSAIWTGLVSSLDKQEVLSAEREKLLASLFADRFAVASRQELAGLAKASEVYNTKLNDLVAEWKKDLPYCALRLVQASQRDGLGVIVVIDNTDQYAPENQDYCFTTAQQISAELGCVVLISMREERFYNSKIHGLLDAFQNSGFHISSPKPAQVFQKRLEYAANVLKKQGEISGHTPKERLLLSDSVKYLSIIDREFRSEKSPLNTFLTACAHGDTRLSLDLFRSFLLSGYTNAEEIVSAGSWNFLIHQVIKPVMIPTRYFYDEILSEIPNIYQLRHNRHSSHFTSLRILRKLSKVVESGAAGYVAMAELRAYFAEVFNMVEDFEKNADLLLKRGLIESNNRMDYYDGEVDSVKVTNYGLYILRELSCYFVYLDLVCTDCGVFDESVSNFLMEAARDEYSLFTRHKRIERIQRRLERVEHFITYLEAEENREREHYGLEMPREDMFTFRARASFDGEKTRVLASAARQTTNGTPRRGRPPKGTSASH